MAFDPAPLKLTKSPECPPVSHWSANPARTSDGAGERAVPRPCRSSRGIDLAVRADCPRLMAGNDYQSHRTPRPGPVHRLADSEGLDPGPDGIAGNQHGGDGRDISALHALGRADPLPGAPGQPVPGFAQRRGRAGRTAAQPPTLAAHPRKPGTPAPGSGQLRRHRIGDPPRTAAAAPAGPQERHGPAGRLWISRK